MRSTVLPLCCFTCCCDSGAPLAIVHVSCIAGLLSCSRVSRVSCASLLVMQQCERHRLDVLSTTTGHVPKPITRFQVLVCHFEVMCVCCFNHNITHTIACRMPTTLHMMACKNANGPVSVFGRKAACTSTSRSRLVASCHLHQNRQEIG
jgi:hypothetical protein